VKVRIAVGLGATALDADMFAAVVGALGPLGFDSLWISEVLTGPGHAMGHHSIGREGRSIGVDAEDRGPRSAVEIVAVESVAPATQIEDPRSVSCDAADQGSVAADAVRPRGIAAAVLLAGANLPLEACRHPGAV